MRPGYRLNDDILLPIFPVPAHGLPEGLTGFRAMITEWGLDWGRFIDVDTRKYDGSPADNAKRLQLGYRLDTSVANPLANLPAAVVSDPPASLAVRNLPRAWRLRLPSGQAVARAMGVKPLHDHEILIGTVGRKGPLPSSPRPSSDRLPSYHEPFERARTAAQMSERVTRRLAAEGGRLPL